MEPVYFDLICDNPKVLTFPFYRDGVPLKDGPSCCISLRSQGSMKFRWNAENKNRRDFFDSINIDYNRVIPIELVHSKTVYRVDSLSDIYEKTGDGTITTNKSLVPSVTVADCVPIYFYNPIASCFGMLHSGWKGTGITGSMLEVAEKEYNARPEDFLFVIGPHIHSCCYDIMKDRAEYFSSNFMPDSVRIDGNGNYKLSLQDANIAFLKKLGVKMENIACCNTCTSCTEYLGSFRRETAHCSSDASLDEKFKYLTTMVAFVHF